MINEALPTKRYFLEFAYLGTHYFGWQKQPNEVSLQEIIEQKLSVILKEYIQIVGAGRTDTGVHAKQMFAHFDTAFTFEKADLIKKLNSFLPKDIAMHKIHEVDLEAHARFDATSRTYEYHMHQNKNPFNENLSWFFYKPLDIDLMNEAGKIICTYHDFECFSKTNTDVKTFLCEVSSCFWTTHAEGLYMTITANRFLRNMVRAIVGTMIDIGTHKISLEDLHQIIKSKNRSLAGFSVPAHGLYLTKITYPYMP